MKRHVLSSYKNYPIQISLSVSDNCDSLIYNIGAIRNSYGNYVIQKALRISQGKDKDVLIQAIQKCIPEIADKKIRGRWEQIV